MDENLLLLDFRLLVDRATEILGKLSAERQIEAVNDGLASVRRKFPDLYEHVRRELSSDESRKQCGTSMVKEEDARMWNNGPNSTVANDVHSKADLNQNFEKIICKEEVKFDDDDFDEPGPASNGSAMRLLNNLDDRNTRVVPSVRGTSYPDDRNCNFSLFPATTSTSIAKSKFGQTSERCKLLSGKLQSLLDGHFPNHLPWKCSVQKFRFYTHDFFMQFLRRDEDLNRNAFRQQILAALEFAVDHRKPFLRNFLIKLVLSGVIIPGVRPPARLIEGSSTRPRELESPPSPQANQPLLSSSNNGMVKDYMELDESSVTEETTQNTDSSEDNGRNGAASPTNSIQTEAPKEKDNDVSSQNARKPKDKQTYECLLCPKIYRKRKSLIDHYKMHPGYCHDCGQPNGTELKEIIEHNRSYHKEDFPFICELCGESYSRRQQFHAHVEAHNKKDVKSYSCGECGMEFALMKLHRQHLEETGHKPDGAICEVCGAGFNSKIALCQHMNRVHKKDNCFECHICQNRFTMKANLERHVQLHTEVKRTYVCDQCGSSYFTYPALREHFSNAHTDASECKCTLCGKTFSSVKSLQRHLPSHSEERPHTCNICSQMFKWKTHLVRHKQAMHGNQPTPKKLKRFAKCDEELVPVDITPPTKQSRKSTPKPKASSSSAATPKSSAGASTKSKTPSTPTPTSTPTTPQLESQNNFTFPSAEKHVAPSKTNTKKSNHLIDMNNFNAGAAENYRYETNKNFAPAQQMAMKPETQQLVAFEGRYQQGSPRPHPQQQQQIHAQASQHQHMHQSPSHHQPPPHHQQAQVLHHQQQHLHQHQPSQQLHQAAHHHHAQQQHISTQIIHSQQPPYHQQPQSRMQSPRRHMQSPQGIMQSPQHHMQSPQPHMQQQPQGHMRHPQAQPHHHPQQPHHHQQQQHMQQQQSQPSHLQHSQPHHQQPSHLPPHQSAPHIPQPQSQPRQDHHAAQQMQYSSEWENMNFNAASASTKEKYFPMIEVSSNDFMGLPMAEMPKNEQQPQQQTMDTTELLGFQNMWSGNNQQLNFNNGNIETNTYSNIGSILTNLELIGNNSPLDFNNYDIMSEHQMGTQQLQHHAYLHQDIDPNSGNINHPVISYDYSSQNHTITDLSNTIQDQKSDFQYHHSRSNYDHSIVSGSGGGGGSGNSSVYNQNENDKVILPPIGDYMHQASLQQQQQQQHQQQQQPGDVNIVYYPVKN